MRTSLLFVALFLLPAWAQGYRGCGGEMIPEPLPAKSGRAVASMPATCPHKDSASLLKFRDETAANIAGKPYLSFYAEFFRPIHQQILLCDREIKAAGLEKEFTNLTAFTKAWSDPGLLLDNEPGAYEAYLKAMPEFAKKPLAFFSKLPTKDWPDAIRRAGLPLIEKKEYKKYDEKSRHRTFTFLEKEDFIQFYLFTENILAMITVEKKDGQGKSLARPRIHFGEYGLGAGADGQIRLPAGAIGRPSYAHCVHCHPSGPRQMIPLPGEVDPGQWPAVDMFNRAIQEIGAFPDYGPYYKPVLLGPSLGGRNNTCTECHDGFTERGILNNIISAGPTPPSTYKITTEWSMPPPPRNVGQIMESVRRLKGISPALALDFQKATLEKGDRPARLMDGAAFMKEKGALSEKDYAVLEEYMERAKTRNTQIADHIYDDYRADLHDWLKAAR